MQQPQMVVLVDEQDREIGLKEKVSAHLGQGTRHRAFSVFLHNEKGEILQTTISNAYGAFVFANLPADQSFLVKMDDQEAALAVNTRVSIMDKNGKKIVDASRDAQGQVQFNFPAPDKMSSSLMFFDDVYLLDMKGKFTSTDNKPLTNSTVNLIDDKGKIIQTVTTDENGKFTFTVLPLVGSIDIAS